MTHNPDATHNKIGTRFIADALFVLRPMALYAFVVFSVFLISISWLKWNEYQTQHATLERDIIQQVERIATPLSLFDYQIAQEQSEQIVKQYPLRGLRITDQFEFVVFEHISAEDVSFTLTIPLEMDSSGQKLPLGTAQIAPVGFSVAMQLPRILFEATFFSLAVMVPIAFVLVLFLRRFVQLPLTQLDRAIAKTLQTKEISLSPYYADTAFGDLAKRFNEMQKLLFQQRGELDHAIAMQRRQLEHAEKISATLRDEQELRRHEVEIINDILFAESFFVTFRTEDGKQFNNLSRFQEDVDPFIQQLAIKPEFELDALQRSIEAQIDVSLCQPINNGPGAAPDQRLMIQTTGDKLYHAHLIGLNRGFKALVISDHTAISRSEQERAAKRKLEALGALSSGVAHDFNNILAVIAQAIEALEVIQMNEQTDSKDDVQENLDVARAATERAGAVVANLLTFARAKPATRSPVRLSDFFDQAAPLIRATLYKAIQLSIDVSDDCIIKVNSDELYMLIMNLAVNARQAMPEGGRFHISAHKDVRDPSQVELRFKDTGIGMEKDQLERIFDPYFTTKPMGKGIGLGLSTAYGFVHSAAGQIRCESTLGVGTEFIIHFPAINAAEKVSDVPNTPTVKRTTDALKDRRIILVEDERALLRLMEKGLTAAGANVTSFPCVSEVREAALSGQLSADIMVTDNALTDGRGPEVIEIVHNELGPIPTLIATGYLDEGAQRCIKERPSVEHLEKPFRIKELAARLELAYSSAAHPELETPKQTKT